MIWRARDPASARSTDWDHNLLERIAPAWLEIAAAEQLAAAYKAMNIRGDGDLAYLRMRRAMLSACWESCSRFLTSKATERRDRSGWSFQMASAWLCHRCHCGALRARFSAVGWSCPSM